MAPHGKQMTPEEKQIIVALSQQGYSSYKIAEMTGKNRDVGHIANSFMANDCRLNAKLYDKNFHSEFVSRTVHLIKVD
jgi:hypothetical protein